MLDIRFIRENSKLVKENMKKRFMKPEEVDELLKADEEWRKVKYDIDQLRSRRNKLSQEINQLKKSGKDAKKVIAEAKKIPDEVKKKEEKAVKLQKKIVQHLYSIPNILDKSVPIGKDEKENVVRKTWGKIKKQDFKLKSHGELIEQLKAANGS